jgi:hypothetical protein
MLEASYNNNYNIDAPKSEVSSDINHQRPAVTSMSHKSIIGKTRVSTKQVKLSKNRPLTSPDGFGIYYWLMCHLVLYYIFCNHESYYYIYNTYQTSVVIAH